MASAPSGSSSSALALPEAPLSQAKKRQLRQRKVTSSLASGQRHFGEDHDEELASEHLSKKQKGRKLTLEEMDRACLATPWPCTADDLGRGWRDLQRSLGGQDIQIAIKQSNSSPTGHLLTTDGSDEDEVRRAFWDVVTLTHDTLDEVEKLVCITVPPFWVDLVRDDSYQRLGRETFVSPGAAAFDPVQEHKARLGFLLRHTYMRGNPTTLSSVPEIAGVISDHWEGLTLDGIADVGLFPIRSLLRGPLGEAAYLVDLALPSPGPEETLNSMGAQRTLAMLGQRLREIPGYATRFGLVTAGNKSVDYCYPEADLRCLATQDRMLDKVLPQGRFNRIVRLCTISIFARYVFFHEHDSLYLCVDLSR